jgi:hypothetical protein
MAYREEQAAKRMENSGMRGPVENAAKRYAALARKFGGSEEGRRKVASRSASASHYCRGTRVFDCIARGRRMELNGFPDYGFGSNCDGALPRVHSRALILESRRSINDREILRE